jgi:hypothetical protein
VYRGIHDIRRGRGPAVQKVEVREVKSEEGKLEGGEVRASRCHLYMVRNVDA